MPRPGPAWTPSERLDEAFAHARRLHRTQSRKTAATDGGAPPPGAPYIGHLLAVAGIIIDHGGTETQAIAGLLHDSIEDTEADSEEKLAALVGAEVAAIVRACTDVDDPDQKDREKALCTCRRADAWWERKRAYLDAHCRDLLTCDELEWLAGCDNPPVKVLAVLSELVCR